MIVWTFAILFIACCGIIGWYVGAVRAAITTVTLLLTLWLLAPLTTMVGKLLPSVGAEHPFVIWTLAPFLVFLILQIIAKSISQAVRAPIDSYYRYKATDTQRMLFERMNQRLGPCLGVVNALFYTILVGIAATGLGYGTIAFSRGNEKDAWWQKTVNAIARSYQATGMARVAGPYITAKPLYFEIVDVLAEWFHQPNVQSSFATYPPFIPLAERADFQAMGNDVQTQEFLFKMPGLPQLLEHSKIGALLVNPKFLDQVLGLLESDLADLKGYIRTLKSEKYDGEKILGRWDFNMFNTVNENKRARRMTVMQVNAMRALLASQLDGVTLLATVDKKILVRKTAPDGNITRREGTWKSDGDGKYQVTIPVGDDRSLDIAVTAEAKKLNGTAAGYAVVFDRW